MDLISHIRYRQVLSPLLNGKLSLVAKALLNYSIVWLVRNVCVIILDNRTCRVNMPYKFNESRRDKIKKSRYRVTNW